MHKYAVANVLHQGAPEHAFGTDNTNTCPAQAAQIVAIYRIILLMAVQFSEPTRKTYLKENFNIP